jgi:hypothetical protein
MQFGPRIDYQATAQGRRGFFKRIEKDLPRRKAP